MVQLVWQRVSDGSKYHYVIIFALTFSKDEVLVRAHSLGKLIDGVEWLKRVQLWWQEVDFCCFVLTFSTIRLVVWVYFKGVVIKVFSNYKRTFCLLANIFHYTRITLGLYLYVIFYNISYIQCCFRGNSRVMRLLVNSICIDFSEGGILVRAHS